MKNFRQFSERIGTAGQPTAAELKAAADAGYQDVVNLAPPDTQFAPSTEGEIVMELGMGYHAIPVDWEQPKQEDFYAFLNLMRSLKDNKVLVHCAANFRVSAFIALYAMSDLDLSEVKADEFVRSVWEPTKYPAWENLVRNIKNDIFSR